MFSPECNSAYRSAVLEWLAAVQSSSLLSFTAGLHGLTVECGTALIAEQLWRSRHSLVERLGREIRIELLVCDRRYGVHPHPSLKLEESLDGADMNLDLALPASCSGCVAEYLIALDRPRFTCHDVRAPLKQRLNRTDAIGKPLDYLDPEIAQPRRIALEAFIDSNGKPQTFHYVHYWNSFNWVFDGEVVAVPDRPNFARLRIYDGAAWQPEAWQSRLLLRQA